MTVPKQTPSSAGPGVDASGKPVVDPSANVMALVEAANQRQDDLREMSVLHSREISTLRAAYEERLRLAETARVDAIRAVDVGNVQRAAEVQTTQASTLASQVVTSAEALRTQVAAAAGAAQVSLAAALVPLQEAIADLRRSQYEAQGSKINVVENQSSSNQNRGNALVVIAIMSALVALASVVVAISVASNGA